jgi:hypothetical protein
MRRWILIACLSSLVVVAAAPGARQETRPDVLFIALDDLNDWVGVLGGHPQASTPNIDALARRGTLFFNAHTPAPLCNPSRSLNDPNEWTNLAPQARYKATLAEYRLWLPKVDRPPVPGSRSRILTRDGDGWSWEGERIR